MFKERPDKPKRPGRKPGAKNRHVKISLTGVESLDIMIFFRENPKLLKKTKVLRLLDERLLAALKKEVRK